jgi:plastocyanin
MKAIAIGLAAAALIAGCGSSTPAQPAGSTKVTMTEYHFEPSAINATAGKVVFFLVNSGTQQHDLVIKNSSGTRVAGSDLVSAGDSFVFTVDSISAGSYTFICDQPGHEAGGMKGTLTIS